MKLDSKRNYLQTKTTFYFSLVFQIFIYFFADSYNKIREYSNNKIIMLSKGIKNQSLTLHIIFQNLNNQNQVLVQI